MTDEPREESQESTEAATSEAVATTEGEETQGEEQPTKLSQEVEIKDVGPCKKHIKVTVSRDDIDKLLNTKFSELVVESNVAGFRPGKAPRKVIERRFRKDVFEQARGELLLASLEQLAEDHDLAPLTAPDIDPAAVEIPDSGPLVYEFQVEVRPEFDLPNYRGLKLTRPVQTFTDEDVDREMKRILAPYGQIVPKEGDSPAVELGDYIVADLTTKAPNGQPVGTAQELMLRVDTQLAFKDAVSPRFGEQVVGAKAGETREITIVLSDAVADPVMRGRELTGELAIKDVKMVRLPEITHELMHNFGVHSEEQLRELIMVLLERRLKFQQRQSAREQVLAQIADAATWDLPRDLLIRQARRSLNRQVMEMRAAGMSDEEINARQRLLQQDVVETTSKALKEHFVLQKIAEVEKIDIDEDDINDEIERIADQNNESPRRLRARLEKDDLLEALATEIVERKALDLVLESAEYEDVPVGKAAEAGVATVEQQAMSGELRDPTEAPAETSEEQPTTESQG